MKKNLLLLLLLVITSVEGVVADPIGPLQALKIASSYLKENLSSAQMVPMHRSLTRSMTSDADSLAPLYVINRGENAGFVIVSGDNCLPEIIGYTDSGDFVEEDMPPALLDMLAGYAELIEKAQAENAPARVMQRAPADRRSIQPIIQAHWHQTAPYNNLAPFLTGTTNRAVTGCTCTAAVMVLHHFRRDLPSTLQATTPTYGYGDAPVTVSYPKGTPIHWDLMLNDYNRSYPEEMGNAVAVLNAAFGAGIWQTYGSSTSGQISNIVDGYNSYFNLSSTCQYKGGTSQATWENLVYSNLSKGQPMVYAGVHPSNGGHAIILDGYNANNNLFHFNFGWGGQGDGYYTLDDETGVNGFSGQQGMVYNITPKKQKLKGKIDVGHLYKRVNNEIRVTVTNEGTLDYFGFYLYWSTSDKAPTSSTAISSKNTELVLATNETGEFTATFKPILERTYYLYLTDKRYNVLDKAVVTVEPSEPHLTLQDLAINASSVIETDSMGTYRMLYDDELTVQATISNDMEATPTQPKFTFELLAYDTEQGDFVLDKKESVDALFENDDVQVLKAVFEHLDSKKYYKLRLAEKLSNVDSDVALAYATTDTLIPFRVALASLDSVSVVDGVMTLKGDWNDKRFAELATDISVIAYDLTAVKGISTQPIAANPNALFYMEENSFGGYNIIAGSKCEDLRLQQGYPYRQLNDFVAEKAMFSPSWEPGVWYTLALPFEVELPSGYLCRQPTEITNKIVSADVVDKLQAHTPYLLATSNVALAPIVANQVAVTREGASQGIAEFQAVVGNAIAGNYSHLLDTETGSDTQYFLLVDSGSVIPAFTGVINVDAGRIRATVSTTLDRLYQNLGVAISEARSVYDAYSPIVEDEWNGVLQDSIASADGVFVSMSITSTSEVKKVANNLLAFLDVYKLQLKDKSNPICYTSFIDNPSFEDNSKSGWISDTNAKVRAASNLATYGVGLEGNYLLYNESTSGSTTIKQTIAGLQKGYYRLTAMVGTSEGHLVTLFAGDSIAHVAAHEWGRFYLSEGMVDSVWVGDGELTIGVEGGDAWYKVDAFNLYYLGAEDETTGIMSPIVEQAPAVIRKGIYDLKGRKLTERSQMQPGCIYLVDGKKVMRIAE